MRIAILMSRASSWSRKTAMRLAQSGHKIHVIDFASELPDEGCFSVRDEFQQRDIAEFCQLAAGVHLIRSHSSSGLRYFLAVSRLRQILRCNQIEFLLTLYGGGFASMAVLSRFRPYAVFAVGSDILMAAGFKRRIARLSLTSASAVFANGDYLARKTRALAPHANIIPLLLGVDTKIFSPETMPEDGMVQIVCTRSFSQVYNNDYLVRALRFLPNSLHCFQVTFVSPGPMLAQVKSLADEILPLELRRRVIFLGGVTSQALVETLKKSQVYVSLSRSDGTSASLLEGLACGLFPVLSDIPQNREWINSGVQNGILVPFDQPEELAGALERAISDADLRRKASLYNRQQVLERADEERNIAILSSRLEVLNARLKNKYGDPCKQLR